MTILADGYDSQHWVVYTTQEGLLAYTLTGVALCNLRGTGPDYYRDTLRFEVPIPDLPDRQALQLRHWAPFFTLSSISNDETATNAAWAVDAFRLVHPTNAMKRVFVECSLAVRDVDGFVLRVGYVIHLLGELVPLG